MVWRICAKLFLKVILALTISLGGMSYTLYLSGGNPMALLSKLGQNMLDSVQSSASNSLSSVKKLPDFKLNLSSNADSASSNKVYSWRDESGQMHYSTSKPAYIDSQVLSYHPETNTIQPARVTELLGNYQPRGATFGASEQNSHHVAANSLLASGGVEVLANAQSFDPENLMAAIKARNEALDNF